MTTSDKATENVTLVLLNLNTSNFTNNEENEAFYDFVHGLYLYAIPIICCAGIVGNICAFKVCVFTYFSKQPSTIYLASLSLSDTWFLIALLVGWFGSLNEYLSHTGAWCLVAVYISYLTSFLSAWYIVLVSVDRYIVVCHPLHGPKLCTKKRSLIATLIVTIFGMLFYSHCFFTNEVILIDSRRSCRWKQFHLGFITVFTYIDTTLTFILPFITVIILNMCVIIAIRRFSFRHINVYQKKYYSPPCNVLSKAQVRMTMMLVVVSTFFLILNLPSHGIRFYILVNNLISDKNIPLFLAQQVCQIIYYVNFGINFLLYVGSSKAFRRYLNEPMRCRQPVY